MTLDTPYYFSTFKKIISRYFKLENIIHFEADNQFAVLEI